MTWQKHRRFLFALCAGIAIALVPVTPVYRVILGADLFCATFLALMLHFSSITSPAELRRHSAEADEGIGIILLFALIVFTLSLAAVVLTLNAAATASLSEIVFALAGIPLGWAMLQTVTAFHYARLYFGPQGKGGKSGGLSFEGTREPGPWEFLYYAFTIGMTAQVSDTVVTTTTMRKATLAHSVLSFFFNTIILALVVNTVVSLGK